MAPTLAPGDRILLPVNLVHHRALGLHVVWKRCVVRVEIPSGHAESLLGRTSMELNDDLDEACDEAMREACPAANTGSGTPPSSPRARRTNWGVTGRGTSNLLDVRLGRAAAQDDPRGQRPDRLGQADPLGQPTAQQVGLPGRGRLPRAAGPAKRNDRRLILRPHAFARCPACLEAAGIPLVGARTWNHQLGRSVTTRGSTWHDVAAAYRRIAPVIDRTRPWSLTASGPGVARLDARP